MLLLQKKLSLCFKLQIHLYEALHTRADTFVVDDYNSGYFFLPEASQQ